MDGRRKCSKAVDLFFLEFQRGMKIVFKRDFQIGVSQNFAERFGIHAICDTASGKRVPLRYNNDKQKKPLFSRGLSVCRLLFNSFSKLKIDENYKEKRRLFY